MQSIFPPGCIIILILLIDLLFIKKKKKIAIFLTVWAIFLLFFLSSWLGEYALLRTLEDDFLSLQEISIDQLKLINPAIVVLGGNMIEDSLMKERGETEIGEVTLARLYGAYLVYCEIGCPILVSGGVLPGLSGGTPVAVVMKQALENFGISPGWIHQETKSRTTFENARFSLEKIEQQGYIEVILVTSAVHMRRSFQAFKSKNNTIKIIPAPVNYLFENAKPGILNILPNQSSWNHNLRALHEWIGLLYYQLFYE